MRFKKFFLQHWPVFAIFLLVFIFFWKFFLKGLIPIPADIIVGMYYPWLDYKWGYSVGVPVKNSILSDAVSQFWVWRNLAIDLFRSGQNPFWNPYSLAGSPLVPVFHSSFFSPFNMFFLFNKTLAMGLIVLTQPLLAMILMYWLLKNWKLSPISSLFGSLIFGFSGFMLNWLEWGNVGHTFLWLPALILFTDKFSLTRAKKYLLLLLLFLGFSLSGGHPQSFFYCFVLWMVYFIWSLKKDGLLKAFGLTIVVLLFFISIFSFQIFPAAESFLFSIRATENYIADNNFGFFPLFHLITFIAPDFFGNPATGNWWGDSFNYQELMFYFGLIPLVFVLIALTLKEKKFIFWKFTFLLSAILAFKYPLGWLIYYFKLPLLSTASASRIFMITSFAGAILAAVGLEAIFEDRVKHLLRFFYPFWILILGYGIPSFLIWFFTKKIINEIEFHGEGLKIISNFLLHMRVGIRNLFLPLMFLISCQLTILLVVKVKKNIYLKKTALLLIVILTAGELFRFGWKYNTFVNPQFYFPSTEATEKLIDFAGNFRIEREKGEVLPPNMWIPYKLYSASGYDPVYPLNYSKYLAVLSGGDTIVGRYGEIDNYKSPLFDLLGIKYLIGVKRDDRSVVDSQGKVSYLFDLEKIKQVSSVGSLTIMENIQSYPRAFFVNKVLSEKNEKDIAVKIKENDYNLRETAFVLSFNENLPETNLSENKVEIVDYQSGKVELKTSAIQRGFLVLTDTYYPGWKAFVDEKQVKVYETDLAFRGIVVPEGEHLVKFTYDPISIKLGLIISEVGLSGLLLFLLKDKFLSKNNLKKLLFAK